MQFAYTRTTGARFLVSLRLGEARVSEWPAGLQNALTDYFELIAFGGLAGPATPPDECTATLRSLDLQPGMFTAVADDVVAPPGVLVVLRRVLEYMDAEVVSIEHADVTWNGPIPSDFDADLEEVFNWMDPSSLDLEMDLTEDPLDLEVRLTGGQDEAEELLSRFGTWFSVVSAGGFDDRGADRPRSSIALADEPMVSPGLMRCELVDIGCSAAAFTSLAHVLGRFSREVASIHSVRLS